MQILRSETVGTVEAVEKLLVQARKLNLDDVVKDD